MSFRNLQQNNIASKNLSGSTYNINGLWVRNPSWLTITGITSSDQKFKGLYQINRYANFIALTFSTSGAANYTIDWGDGSAPVSVASGSAAYYEYDWTNSALDGTNAPVTFTASSNTINRNNHGYSNGMNISFATIVTTTGIIANQIYYVVNATTNSFQVSNTIDGSAITLTNDGTGTILPYKQVIVTVTPSSGNLTVANLNTKHNQSGLVNGYTAGWLDVAFAGSYTTLTCQGNLNNVVLTNIQQVNVLSSSLTSYASLFAGLGGLENVVGVASNASPSSAVGMFSNCVLLQNVGLFDTSTISNTNTMFSSCGTLLTIPPFNMVSVTDASSMFQNCAALLTIPPINTINLANAQAMFLNCVALSNVPLINTSNVTTTVQMFQGCSSLQNIPLLNTANVANAQQMFQACTSLVTIPKLNTINVTNMSSMFNGCNGLQSIPLINTSNAISMASMFQNCFRLQTIPLIDTSNVTSMASMFNACRSLEALPLLNTINNTSMQAMFQGAFSIETIPAFNTSNVTTMVNGFANSGIVTFPVIDTSKVSNFNAMFNGASTLESLPLLNTSNANNLGFMFNGASRLQTIPALNCRFVTTFFTAQAGISEYNIVKAIVSFSVANSKLSAAALNAIYTNLPKVGGSVTFQDSTDTVTITNHGYSEGDTIRFSTITTTTGISINTTYVVRNPTTDTFQLSLTDTGSIINLVNNGTGTRASATITVTGNYGTTGDDPTIATAKGWTVTGS